ncbi:hypothetical protein OT109_09135 [Phycisphaeraceae bacterium D3-23]
MMLRLRNGFVCLAAAACLVFAAGAWAGDAPEGWASGEDAAQALAVARERGLPVAFLYMDFDER